MHQLIGAQDVRGYYECAFTRFVDVIYQGIRAELFTSCRNELGTALKTSIGLGEKDGKLDGSMKLSDSSANIYQAEQRCTILLAVDPESQRIRVELTKQKENLEKACDWLDSHAVEE